MRISLGISLVLLTATAAFAGAWGFRTFENDEALDWVAQLESTSGTRFLGDTLRAVDPKADYIDMMYCSTAFAAAEVIAAARGRPGKGLPAQASAWVARVRPAVSAELLATARSAVATCRNADSSELRELWKDSADGKAWLDDAADLLARLK